MFSIYTSIRSMEPFLPSQLYSRYTQCSIYTSIRSMEPYLPSQLYSRYTQCSLYIPPSVLWNHSFHHNYTPGILNVLYIQICPNRLTPHNLKRSKNYLRKNVWSSDLQTIYDTPGGCKLDLTFINSEVGEIPFL